MTIFLFLPVSSHGFIYSPTQHFHQKSASYGNNLYQQAHPQVSLTSYVYLFIKSLFQQNYPCLSRPGMNHNHSNGVSAPTLQSPASTFTQEQVDK
jgi:hypothetical protein